MKGKFMKLNRWFKRLGLTIAITSLLFAILIGQQSKALTSTVPQTTASTGNLGDTLYTNTEFTQTGIFDYILESSNKRFQLKFQRDRNLVLYDTQSNQAIWSSGTSTNVINHPTINSTGPNLVMQDDGNLVIYAGGSQNNLVWSSGTAGTSDSYYLKVQDDGNVVIYKPSPVWATNTAR